MASEKFNMLVAEKKFLDDSGRLVPREITSLAVGESTDFMGLSIQFSEKPPFRMGGKDDEGVAIVIRLSDNDESRPLPDVNLHIQRRDEKEQVVTVSEMFKKDKNAGNIFVVAGLDNIVYFQIVAPGPSGNDDSPSVVLDLKLQSQVGEGNPQMLH
jgi:hypothetical protein